MSKPPVELTLEFSRPLELARVPKLGSHEKLSADPSECKALAKRLMVPDIHAVTAHLQARPWRGGGLKVWGEVTVDLTQESVISLEAFRTTQVIAVERYYLEGKGASEQDVDLEIDPVENGVVDLGELVAETIALELDPYPRKPGEVFASDEPPTQPENEVKPNPFNVLKLRERQK